MSILETVKLTKIYGKGDNKVEALKEVSISIENGKFTTIIGPSGSGKSTLLHCMAGLDVPTSGEVLLNGENIFNLSEEKLSILRRRNFGFVFQSFNLIPVIDVYENITLPVSLDNKKIDKDYISEIIEILGLESKIKSFPNELSGGQQQRVAIARALSNKPDIIFADEPTGNLDSKTADEVMKFFKLCVEKFGQTLIMVTHNKDIAASADVCITIQDGKILSYLNN
ncbi:ABC transporter ATP-binding protein [Thermoanaerobacterium thermosaccharolyticum]|uniref:ABC transporter ATP-binding protein n=1 Tax=Thermoanaerobacterium thermosaccharolyticum TaxID=1517 RepID=UPI003D2D29F5